MASLPSLTHSSTLPLDHCHYYQDCFNGPVTHFASTFELLILILFGFALLKGIAGTCKKIWRTAKLKSKINNLQQDTSQKNSILINATEPMAFSIGFIKPTIIFSTGLLDKISVDTLDIIECHERVHQQHKDNFSKLIMGFFAQFHSPTCQKKTLEQHSLVLELRADLQTGTDTQKSLAVAETIIKLHKLFNAQTPDTITCSFSGSNIEQRIHYLINPPKQSSLEKRFVLACFTGLAMIAALGSAPFHNLLEVFFLS